MYVIHKTDGTIAAAINDGVIDRTNDLPLVGKNVNGYGTVVMENFVKLLEHFANDTPPTKPITGELWYDTDNKKLMVYQGSAFRVLNAVKVSSSMPELNQDGDLWYDSNNQQLKFYANSQYNTITPIYTAAQGISGPIVTTVQDNIGNSHVITKIYTGGTIIGIFAEEDFTPSPVIDGFTDITQGFNLLETGIMNATARNSQRLGNLLPASYMRTDANTSTTGTLGALNNGGITLGSNSDGSFFIDGNQLVVRSNYDGAGMVLQTRYGGGTVPALTLAGNGQATFSHDVVGESISLNANITVAENAVVIGDAEIDGNANILSNLNVTGNANVSSNVDVVGTATVDYLVANTGGEFNSDLSATTLSVSSTPGQHFTDATAIMTIDGNLRLREDTQRIHFGLIDNQATVRAGPNDLYFTTNQVDRIHVAGSGQVTFTNQITGPSALFTTAQIGQMTFGGHTISSTVSSLNIVAPNLNTSGNFSAAGGASIAGAATVGSLDTAGSITAGPITSSSTVTAANVSAPIAFINNLTSYGTSVFTLASIGILNAGSIAGDLTGNVVGNLQGTATNATNAVNAQNAGQANFATISQSVSQSYQPNITDLGHLNGLSTAAVSCDGNASFGNISVLSGNISANNFIGNITGRVLTGSQPSITSLGTLTDLNMTGVLDIIGEIRCHSDIIAFYSSDERLKENVEPISGALEKVSRINGVYYNWNSLAKSLSDSVDDRRQVGVIAQEVQAAMPELVIERDNGYLAVDYQKMTALLLQALQELSAEVKVLKARVDSSQF